jgi:hypothetical protein
MIVALLATFIATPVGAAPPTVLTGELSAAREAHASLATTVCSEAYATYVAASNNYALAEGSCGNPEMHAVLERTSGGRWTRSTRCHMGGGGVIPDEVVLRNLSSAACGVPLKIAYRLVALRLPETYFDVHERFAPQPPGSHCVTSTVTEVGSYFKDQPSSGSVVAFGAGPSDPYRATVFPGIVNRTRHSTAALMTVGDHVQVCLVSVPPIMPGGCDPRKDGRGRVYKVWDYDRQMLVFGGNSNHGCGGA